MRVVIQSVDRRFVSFRGQVSMNVHCNLDALVTQLVSYIGQGFSSPDEQAGVTVPKIVGIDLAQSPLFQCPFDCAVPPVAAVERRSRLAHKNPFRDGAPPLSRFAVYCSDSLTLPKPRAR